MEDFLKQQNEMNLDLQETRRIEGHNRQLEYEWRQPLNGPVATPELRSQYFMNRDFAAGAQAISQLQQNTVPSTLGQLPGNPTPGQYHPVYGAIPAGDGTSHVPDVDDDPDIFGPSAPADPTKPIKARGNIEKTKWDGAKGSFDDYYDKLCSWLNSHGLHYMLRPELILFHSKPGGSIRRTFKEFYKTLLCTISFPQFEHDIKALRSSIFEVFGHHYGRA